MFLQRTKSSASSNDKKAKKRKLVEPKKKVDASEEISGSESEIDRFAFMESLVCILSINTEVVILFVVTWR